MIDWGEVTTATLRELGRVTVGPEIAEQCPTLVMLFDPKRRLLQDGPMAQFEGGFSTAWETEEERYVIRDVDVHTLGSARAIVDHIVKLRYDATLKLCTKIEAKAAGRNYDLGRTRGITLADWWLRETAFHKVGSLQTEVYIVCAFAFGPWTPPEADVPAIAGKVGG